MDLQSRKIQFIQEFLKYANTNILDQFEEMLKHEREKVFEKEIEPMTLKEYELRVEKAIEDVKSNRVKSARKLKQENFNMEIVVVWSDNAIEELRSIYDYLYFNVSKKVADKFSNAIVDKTILLEQTPRVGQKEEMLAHLNKEIRYLIEGNYKIVYWIDEDIISIATVFDCRMNPKKLKRKNT